MTAIMTNTTRKKQDFADNADYPLTKAQNLHTYYPQRVIMIAILQGVAVGVLVGFVGALIMKGF